MFSFSSKFRWELRWLPHSVLGTSRPASAPYCVAGNRHTSQLHSSYIEPFWKRSVVCNKWWACEAIFVFTVHENEISKLNGPGKPLNLSLLFHFENQLQNQLTWTSCRPCFYPVWTLGHIIIPRRSSWRRSAFKWPLIFTSAAGSKVNISKIVNILSCTPPQSMTLGHVFMGQNGLPQVQVKFTWHRNEIWLDFPTK